MHAVHAKMFIMIFHMAIVSSVQYLLLSITMYYLQYNIYILLT